MDLDSAAILIMSVCLEAAILVRAARNKLFIQLPFFCSYMAYVLCGALVCTLVFYVLPGRYATAFWFHVLIVTLAEFGVVLELADKAFRSYPPVLPIGRIIVVGISLLFLASSIIPSIVVSRPSDLKLLDLLKYCSLAKCVAIVAILWLARICRLTLARPIAGIVIGFAIYFSVSTANYAAAGEFGRSLYAGVLARLVPLSYALALLIWTVSLWGCQVPVTPARPDYAAAAGLSLPMREQLKRFNASLIRVLRRK